MKTNNKAGKARGVEPDPLTGERYRKELAKLQLDLVKMQEWIVENGLKVLVIFEGRDAAGKGGVIKRITESLNPRVCRVVALAKPTEREPTQWIFQRYVAHLPAAGKWCSSIKLVNRAGVDRVMGFATKAEVQEFFRSCPEFEHALIRWAFCSSGTGSRSAIPSRNVASRSGLRTPPSGGN